MSGSAHPQIRRRTSSSTSDFGSEFHKNFARAFSLCPKMRFGAHPTEAIFENVFH